MEQRSISARRDALILLVASLAIFLNTVDISILNVAVPVIQRDLGISTTLLQWLQTAYGLPYAGFLLLGGRLADLVGRRKIFLIGVALFGTASLAGTIAPGIAWLLAARAAQGVGAALMVPSAISIVSMTFAEGAPRNHALGIFAAVAATGFSSGLAAGALITEFLSWRWIFFVNVPIAAIILAFAAWVVAPDGSRQRVPLDLAGAVLVTAGLLVIVHSITLFGQTTMSALAWLIFGAALLAAFAHYERRVDRPLVPLSLFALPSLRSASIASVAQLGSAFGFFFLASMFVQTAAGFSALEAGFALLPMSIVSACVSLFAAPRLAGRFGARRLLGLGLVLNAAGLILFIMANPSNALMMTITASVVLGGLGMGLGYPAANLVALEGVSPELQATVSGIQNTSLQIGGAIGTAITAAVLGSYGTQFATLTAGDQAAARTTAALILAVMALSGLPALLRLRGPQTLCNQAGARCQ